MSLDAFEQAGVPTIHSKDSGRLSDLARLAVALHEQGIPLEDFRKALKLSDREVLSLHYSFKAELRPLQKLPEGNDWRILLAMGGRGAGKSRLASCAIIEEAQTDREARTLLVGPTLGTIREVFIEGPSGIIACAPWYFRPVHKKTAKLLVWPNGALTRYRSVDKGVAAFKGGGYSFIVVDEAAAFEPSQAAGIWKELLTIARHRTKRMKKLNRPARVVLTTTPDIPEELEDEILKDTKGLIRTVQPSFDNAANLEGEALARYRRLANTELGRVLFLGEAVRRGEALLFTNVDFNASRITLDQAPEFFDRIVIGVDPTTGGVSGIVDTCGIVAVGFKDQEDKDGNTWRHAFILEDASMKATDPADWARRVVETFRRYARHAEYASVLVEVNKGGGSNAALIRMVDPAIPIQEEFTHDSKVARAKPVAMLWQGGFVHLVGHHPQLEEEFKAFTGKPNKPDGRVDATCWPVFEFAASSELALGALAQAGA